MEEYGDFTGVINRLESSLNDVRTVWTDQTAVTYDAINDNMKHFSREIWNYYNNSVAGYNMVKANYNEAEFQNTVNQLSAKVAAV